MKKFFSIFFSLLGLVLAAGHPEFKHDVSGDKKPWTNENFPKRSNSNGEFSFAVLPDRSGGIRRGVFPRAIDMLNKLQPEFVVSVGDQVGGIFRKNQRHDALRAQWKEVRAMTEKLTMPFFYLVGNHDIGRKRAQYPEAHEISSAVWKEQFGPTYYSFIYRDTLFLILDSMSGKDGRKPSCSITDEQMKWAIATLRKNTKVRWTFVFLHAPTTMKTRQFLRIEKELTKRKYTVFMGDWHRYIKFSRYGRNYYVLATAGGVSKLRGKEYGEFDHVTWVTMTKDGPKVKNILLDGSELPEDVVTSANNKFPEQGNYDIKK